MRYIIILILFLSSFTLVAKPGYPWKKFDEKWEMFFDKTWENDTDLKYQVWREIGIRTDKNILQDSSLGLKFFVCNILISKNMDVTKSDLKKLVLDTTRFEIFISDGYRIYEASFGKLFNGWCFHIYNKSYIEENKTLIKFMNDNWGKRFFYVTLKGGMLVNSIWLETGDDYIFLDEYDWKEYSINKEKKINYRRDLLNTRY